MIALKIVIAKKNSV